MRTIDAHAAVEESALRPYLSVFVIYHDEAHYLREWIEFHKLVGFERFYMYNNFSTDHHREVLAPYIADGTVIHREWPVEPPRWPATATCSSGTATTRDWLGFFDIDEFLFSPTGEKVSDVLRGFEEFPGVGVNEITFGTSGHMTRQPGLAIENFVRRCAIDKPRNRIVKSIVQPTQVGDLGSDPHYFRYLDGRRGVTENKEIAARFADQSRVGRSPAHQPLHDALAGRAGEEERRPRRPAGRPAQPPEGEGAGRDARTTRRTRRSSASPRRSGRPSGCRRRKRGRAPRPRSARPLEPERP